MSDLAEPTPPRSAGRPILTVGFDERLSPPRTALFGLQHLLALTGIWLFPALIGAALDLSHEQTGWLTQGCLFMTGLITVLQSSRLLRLPIVQGPTAAFMLAIIAAGSTFGLGTAFGSMFVAGLIFAALALPLRRLGLFGHIAKLVANPILLGTLLLIIGAQLASIGLSGWFGTPGNPGHGWPFFLISIVTVLAVIGFAVFGGDTIVRRGAIFWGIVIGTVVAFLTGVWSLPAVTGTALVAPPQLLPFGFGVAWPAVVLMLIAFLQAGAESAGMYQLVGSWGGQRVDVDRTNRGLFTEFAGTAVGSLFCGIGTTSYPENAGIVRMSGIGSRFVTLTAGAAALVLAFVPAVGLFIAGLPLPVLAAASTILFGIIALSGVQMMNNVHWDELNLMVAAPAFIIALGTAHLPEDILAVLPDSVASVVTTPMMVGVILLFVLHLVLNVGVRRLLNRPEATEPPLVVPAIGTE
ncbi:uracil permease [Mycolicibacterium chitae]|uniref:Xanthine/uracil permease n=1 Tax=Mycolicibacterium chitae TaxID=1792 RepID=A0A448ID74_MYCCI|nr:solute carrier family 23 protein [Mycolicibacterium chitae]MCV7109114.1 purine/pyrimidine permease [Mycolicibacterium chitae]BBZ01478.1 uracil permease [Mycolicibacterium chitae]VEG50314.1 xanthine/uracil permease [Mycolicibacterium chitae]